MRINGFDYLKLSELWHGKIFSSSYDKTLLYLFKQGTPFILKNNGASTITVFKRNSQHLTTPSSIPLIFKSGFIKYLTIPYAHRDLCILGIPSNDIDKTQTVYDFPVSTKAIYSLCSNKFYPYLKRLFELELNENLEFMLIGLQHDYLDLNNGFDDFSQISYLLSQKSFPKLKVFKYGFDELYVNVCRVYSNLGDITEVIENMPSLEILEITGAFELTKPLNLKSLKSINIDIDLGVQDCNDVMAISQKTLDLLMSSAVNCELESFTLDIINTDIHYQLDIDLFKRNNFFKLKRVSISGNFQSDLKSQIHGLLGSNVKELLIE
ncbi:hypothetical protein OZX61_12395 (plasmid) [Acinetobacter sp. ESL0695]|nr:hypothetical protein [Acinetobacter sp. ESL0695]WEV50130.1 hypothetical protein OZX61_12395 [Acinetobacter sp. ESL0695]